MKIRFLPIFLLALGFSQLGAKVTKINVKVVNKSKFVLGRVNLKPTRVVKFGVKKGARINIEGTDLPVILPVVGKPHGVDFKSNIGKGKSASKMVNMKRFDVSKLAVTYKGRGTGRIGKNVTKNVRIGRLKFDCIYWRVKKPRRSYAKNIEEVLITVHDNSVDVTIKSGF